MERRRVETRDMLGRCARGLICGLALLVMTVSLADRAAAAGGRRVALVIGNAAYNSLTPLDNPGNDVANVSAVLRASGFDVVVGRDLGRVALEKTVERFFRTLDRSDVSLFYYSGHGVQIGGKNYIIPVDASLKSPYDIETQTMNLDTILDFMRTTTKTQLIFLDACRNNPFGSKAYWVADKLETVPNTVGLAAIKAAAGTFIAYATEPGSVSYDGGVNEMSPFSSAFVKRATTPNDEIRSMMSRVRRDVMDATEGRQVPWESSSLLDDVFLMPRRAPPSVAPMTKLTVGGGKAAPLRLPEPRVDGTAKLSVSFDLLPEAGTIEIDGKPVELGKSYDAAALANAVFDAEGAAVGSTNVAAYTVQDELGQAARGLVALAVTDAAAAPSADLVAANDAVESAGAALSKMTVSAPIGVGPVPIADKPLVELASLEGAGQAAQLRITDTPSTGVLRAGGRELVAGAVIDTATLETVSYEPQVGAETEPQTLKVEVVDAQTNKTAPAAVMVTATVEACDRLAGEPLDLQGVTKGVLPNEIKLPDALDACRTAAVDHPDVPRFRYQLGRAELANRDIEAAKRSFAAAAKAGHQRAFYQQGYLAWIGIGQAADQKAANAFYRKNAAFGDPYGMLAYGRNLYYGRGIGVDKAQGLRLMLKAAELGHTYAMNELGAIFVEGRGIAADPARGVAYYRQGATREDIYSLNNLGLAYLRGQGVAQDDTQAFDMFSAADAGSHPGAAANLGFLYLNGRGVAKDPARASQMFETSAQRGDWYGAMMRGDVAADAGDNAEAARFYALAVGLDRNQTAKEPRAKLAGLPVAAKRQALASLDAKGPAKPLDAAVVKAALADWKRRNPRLDLF